MNNEPKAAQNVWGMNTVIPEPTFTNLASFLLFLPLPQGKIPTPDLAFGPLSLTQIFFF